MSKMTADEIADEISNFVNNFNRDEEGFVKALRQQHRTLQQNTTRMFLKYIESFADTPDNRLDARNQGSKEIAVDIIAGFQKEISAKHNYDCKSRPSEHLGSI